MFLILSIERVLMQMMFCCNVCFACCSATRLPICYDVTYRLLQVRQYKTTYVSHCCVDVTGYKIVGFCLSVSLSTLLWSQFWLYPSQSLHPIPRVSNARATLS